MCLSAGGQPALLTLCTLPGAGVVPTSGTSTCSEFLRQLQGQTKPLPAAFWGAAPGENPPLAGKTSCKARSGCQGHKGGHPQQQSQPSSQEMAPARSPLTPCRERSLQITAWSCPCPSPGPQRLQLALGSSVRRNTIDLCLLVQHPLLLNPPSARNRQPRA